MGGRSRGGNGGDRYLVNVHIDAQALNEGGFGVHMEGSDRVGHADHDRQIRLTTPAGAVLPAAPPQIEIETFQRQHGLAIAHRTGDCRWDGGPTDYDHVGILLGQAESRRA